MARAGAAGLELHAAQREAQRVVEPLRVARLARIEFAHQHEGERRLRAREGRVRRHGAFQAAADLGMLAALRGIERAAVFEAVEQAAIAPVDAGTREREALARVDHAVGLRQRRGREAGDPLGRRRGSCAAPDLRGARILRGPARLEAARPHHGAVLVGQLQRDARPAVGAALAADREPVDVGRAGLARRQYGRRGIDHDLDIVEACERVGEPRADRRKGGRDRGKLRRDRLDQQERKRRTRARRLGRGGRRQRGRLPRRRDAQQQRAAERRRDQHQQGGGDGMTDVAPLRRRRRGRRRATAARVSRSRVARSRVARSRPR